MHYTPSYLADARQDLAALGSDTGVATAYADAHVAGACAANGGVLYDHFLASHRDAAQKCDDLLTAVRSLYEHGSDRLCTTMADYAKAENENVTEVASIWQVLGSGAAGVPIGPGSAGTPSRGPLPSEGLASPQSDVGNWIFDVLSWPDYLSVGSWARKIFGWIWSAVAGGDPWHELWNWLGGDWEGIGLASSAWTELGDYFEASSSELTARMQIMFSGWYDSAGAEACGGYFSAAARAVDAASGPMTAMSTLYHDIAWSSFMLCQAVYSLVDAAIDAIVVFLMGGMTVLEALAALFSGGVTLIPGAVTAVLTIVEALSSAWGWMMTAVYGVTGLGAMLGAATTTITWVQIPEG